MTMATGAQYQGYAGLEGSLAASFWIGGQSYTPAKPPVRPVISPVTELEMYRLPLATVDEVEAAVQSARDALQTGPWRFWTPAMRASLLRAMADELDREGDLLADTITNHNGSPRSFARFGQVDFAIDILRYYADLLETHPLEEMRPRRRGGHALVTHQPVGVVAAVLPWNFPLVLAVSKVAPALAAGCTLVLKPASETPLEVHFLARAAAKAGAPPGVINVLTADHHGVGRLVGHPGIDKVAFTGSTQTGRTVLAMCAANNTRATVELGGKSPAVILQDADLDEAAPQIVAAGMRNNGQLCTAQSRILVPSEIYDDVVDRLVEAVRSLHMGDPMDLGTDIGPLVSKAQRASVEAYYSAAAREGARIPVGGGRGDDRPGWFVEPTLFVDVTNSMTVAREEIFGPALSVIRYQGAADATAIANDSPYGLGASVWTNDPDRGIDFARGLRVGAVGINGNQQDPAVPFGGFKASGFGREFGVEGLINYLETQSIHLLP